MAVAGWVMSFTPPRGPAEPAPLPPPDNCLDALPKALSEDERAQFEIVIGGARALALIDALTEQGAQQAAEIVIDGQRIAKLERRLDVKRRQYETAFRERAEAEARVRELEAERRKMNTILGRTIKQLADANALLRKMREHVLCPLTWHEPIDEILAAQPAAPSRAEADQAVLDACTAIVFCKWEGATGVTGDSLSRLIAAEMARREGQR